MCGDAVTVLLLCCCDCDAATADAVTATLTLPRAASQAQADAQEPRGRRSVGTKLGSLLGSRVVALSHRRWYDVPSTFVLTLTLPQDAEQAADDQEPRGRRSVGTTLGSLLHSRSVALSHGRTVAG